MNRPLLTAVRDAILAQPDRFSMDTWLHTSGSLRSDIAVGCNPATECGTTACIAGWAVVLSPEPRPTLPQNTPEDPWARSRAFAEHARHLLDLTPEQAKHLFYEDDWLEEGLCDAYQESDDKIEQAHLAVEVIDNLLSEED